MAKIEKFQDTSGSSKLEPKLSKSSTDEPKRTQKLGPF